MSALVTEDAVVEDDQDTYMSGVATIDPRKLENDTAMDEEDESEESSESSESSDTSSDVVPSFRPHGHTQLPSGVCYDVRMKFHANADYSDNSLHPEDPRRIEAIMDEFKRIGLVYTGQDSDEKLKDMLRENPNRYMYRIPARRAKKSEICLVHSPNQYEWVNSLRSMSPAQLRQMTATMDAGRKSLYVGTLTFEAALISAGSAIEVCKHVVAEKCKNAFAIIRPPGHHAESAESMGFCIFNNVPIAARVCMQDYPDTCRKVLILDWDVHHGNGIQNMFYEDPNVLYISIHVYQDGNFYPGPPENPELEDGNIANVGVGLGVGRNVNIGWSDQGMGDGDYMAAFQLIVMPIAREFDPDLVIVSAGFDAAAGDDLGGCFVSPECYSQMTHQLMSLANGKIAVCLEGGYNLQAISKSAVAVAKTLMGDPPQRFSGGVLPPCNITSAQVLNQVRKHQAPYWECMRDGYTTTMQELETEQALTVADSIRSLQIKLLNEKHNMVRLVIKHSQLYGAFKDNVLVTPSFGTAQKLAVVVHEPLEAKGHPNPLTYSIPSNTRINDTITPYITSLIAAGYAVIEVNVPSIHSLKQESHLHKPRLVSPPPSNAESLTSALLLYLWDNYISLTPAATASPAAVNILAIGAPHAGVRELLVRRDDVRHSINRVALLPGETPMQTIRSDTDEGLGRWGRYWVKWWLGQDAWCWGREKVHKAVLKGRFGEISRSQERGDAVVKGGREGVLEWFSGVDEDDDQS